MWKKKSLCPWCGDTLEAGTIRGRGGNFFLPEGASSPLWYTHASMRKKNAIMFPPSPYPFVFDWPSALVCRSCKKIIIPYECYEPEE